MASKNTRKITIEISDANMKHLKGIAKRFEDRGIESMSTVEALVEWCVYVGFHSLDTESYDPKDVEPVSVNISGIIAVPPGSTTPGDVRASSGLVLNRVAYAFPCHLLYIGVSAAQPKSKKVKEWRHAIQRDARSPTPEAVPELAPKADARTASKARGRRRKRQGGASR